MAAIHNIIAGISNLLLTVSLSPNSATANGGGSGTGPFFTNAVNSTVSNDVGAITYSWTIDNPNISITSPSGAGTTFSASVSVEQFEFGTATLTITDAATSQQATAQVPVTINNTGGA